MNVRRLLRSRLETALADIAPAAEIPSLADMLVPSQDPKFGDYQINAAMPLGKQLKKPPREVAKAIAEKLDLAGVGPAPEIAGPGFLNLRLSDEWLAARLQEAAADERLAIPPTATPKRYVLDYSGPNVAKPMHVGHIRSTVIGDAIYRTLKFLGHTIIGDNHLGDWGTQFGMIIYGYKNLLDRAAYEANPLEELARLYRHVNMLADQDPAVRAAALAETHKLHHGDKENLQLWREFMPVCREALDVVYRRLHVTFDETLGESFYEDRLAGVVDDLQRKGLATESEGALCVFIAGQDAPMIVRKKDGAFLYATTDLATIRYRMEQWRPDAMLYVVDHRQSLHFEQLFAAAKSWGYMACDFRHLSFGTVLGKDGKPYKTRSGDTVGLSGLLDEAVERALKIVSENDDRKPDGRELSDAERQRVAETVGIGALKYADLSQNRTSDYEFSYDKMLAMNGNTATYMQYAYARVRSIFRRGGVNPATLRTGGAKITLGTPAERSLAVALLRFEEAIELSTVDFRPNLLTTYLFDLANAYSTFFEQCPVLKAPDAATRDSRLLLCDLTARTIKLGLSLLGIDVVEQM
jgi:arginyl-tRNA synthetase